MVSTDERRHGTSVQTLVIPTSRPEKVLMATSLVIEEERGTCSGFAHPHNGYYAGDFSGGSDLGPAVSSRGTVTAIRPAVAGQWTTYPTAA
jgi:hypothetical protein